MSTKVICTRFISYFSNHCHFTGTRGQWHIILKLIYISQKKTKQFVQKTHWITSLSVNSERSNCVGEKETSIVCQCVATMGWLSQWSVTTVRFEAEVTMRRNNGHRTVSLTRYFFQSNVDSHWWRNACKIIKAVYYQCDNLHVVWSFDIYRSYCPLKKEFYCVFVTILKW